VEEQGEATKEISRNIQHAAQGTQRVSSHITNVQYGGSEAHRACCQRTRGDWEAATPSRDLMTSMRRIYSNAYTGAEKQDTSLGPWLVLDDDECTRVVGKPGGEFGKGGVEHGDAYDPGALAAGKGETSL